MGKLQFFYFYMFHPIIMQYFLQTDHLNGLLMDIKKCFGIFFFLKVPKFRKFSLFGRYIELNFFGTILMSFFPLNLLSRELLVVCWQISFFSYGLEINSTERSQHTFLYVEFQNLNFFSYFSYYFIAFFGK